MLCEVLAAEEVGTAAGAAGIVGGSVLAYSRKQFLAMKENALCHMYTKV